MFSRNILILIFINFQVSIPIYGQINQIQKAGTDSLAVKLDIPNSESTLFNIGTDHRICLILKNKQQEDGKINK